MPNLPWDDLADALAAGDEDAAENARERMALLGMAILGFAADRQGPATAERIARLGVPAAVWRAIDEAVEPLREPVAQMHGWMALEIRRLRAENWELALDMARIRLRLERLEGAGDVVEAQDDRRAGGREGAGGGAGQGGHAA